MITSEPMAPVMGSSCPYPGLRSFRVDERHLFFGREEQEDELLDRLEQHRFLAVVGPSGSGKSSLMRAGLMGRLRQGDLRSAGSRWLIAECRPGHHPFKALTEGLLKPSALAPYFAGDENRFARVGAILRNSEDGLVDLLRETKALEGRSLLLLIDQFEEIFTFGDRADSNELAAFITLLLRSSRDPDMGIYVAITMRTEFLGRCSRYPGLTETLNQSQYLTPRMTREECKLAITRPLSLFRSTIDDTTITRLLNDTWREEDQLPLLQHTLMRMWQKAGGPPPDSRQPFPSGIALNNDLYNAAGPASEALDKHAKKIYNDLTDDQKEIAEGLFKRLTGGSREQSDTRRTVQLSEVALVVNRSEDDVREVVEQFRSPGNSFLEPIREPLERDKITDSLEIDGEFETLKSDSVLDIVHESVIRKWRLLETWTAEELRDASSYYRLSLTAKQHEERGAGLYSTDDLRWCNLQYRRVLPFRVWAKRYTIKGDDPERELDRVEGFIVASRQKVERDQIEEDIKNFRQEESDRASVANIIKQDQQKKSITLIRGYLLAIIVIFSVSVLIFSNLIFSLRKKETLLETAQKDLGVANKDLKATEADLKVKKGLVDEASRRLEDARLAETDAAKKMHSALKTAQLALAQETQANAKAAAANTRAAKIKTEIDRQSNVIKNYGRTIAKNSIEARIARSNFLQANTKLDRANTDLTQAITKLSSAEQARKQAEDASAVASSRLAEALKNSASMTQQLAIAERESAKAKSDLEALQKQVDAKDLAIKVKDQTIAVLQSDNGLIRSNADSAFRNQLAKTSPDGNIGLRVTATGSVVTTKLGGKQTLEFPATNGQVTATAFSADGEEIAIAYAPSNANTPTTGLFAMLPEQSTGQNVPAWTVRVYKTFNAEALDTLDCSASIRQVVFSQDGKRLLTLTRTGEVRVWILGKSPPVFEVKAAASTSNPIVFAGFIDEAGKNISTQTEVPTKSGSPAKSGR